MLKLLLFSLLIVSQSAFGYNATESDYDVFSNEDDFFNPIYLSDPKISSRTLYKIYKTLQRYYLPVPRYIDNEDCKTAVKGFPSSLAGGLDSWGFKMGDSWGKLPDGFLFGNIHVIGMYEECQLIEGAVDEVAFQGKYCSVHYSSPDVDNSKFVNPLTRSGPGMVFVGVSFPYYYGSCIPSVCTEEDLFISLNRTLKKHDREVTRVTCIEKGVPENLKTFDGFDAFVMALIILIVVVAIFGTVVDECHKMGMMQRNQGAVSMAFEGVKCFSITDGFKNIFAYRSKTSQDITCLHGLRVITLIWIITCHQYETGVQYAMNTRNAKKYQDPLFGQFITNGYGSVDTFFCLSGILLAFRLFPDINSGQSFRYPQALLRRFVRLFPSIFIVSAFSATLVRFLGFGPRQHYLHTWVLEECRGNWWKDPLFIDNFPIGDRHFLSVGDCLGHCWYTAVEMQLLLIVPFLLIPFIWNKRAGQVWLMLVTLFAITIPVIIILINDLPPLPIPYLTIQEHYEFMTKYYLVPWCRSAPWFVGIWTGMFLASRPKNIPRVSKLIIALGYLFVILLGFAFVLGTFNYNHIGEHKEMQTWLSALYGLLSRPVWGLCLAWVVGTCHLGQAGYVDYLLSWWGWQPLSRLTFAMYLIHPVVQIWWTSTLFVPIYYTYLGKLFEICGVFFTSFVFSVLLSILVERPFLNLTRGFAARKAVVNDVEVPGFKKF